MTKTELSCGASICNRALWVLCIGLGFLLGTVVVVSVKTYVDDIKLKTTCNDIDSEDPLTSILARSVVMFHDGQDCITYDVLFLNKTVDLGTKYYPLRGNIFHYTPFEPIRNPNKMRMGVDTNYDLSIENNEIMDIFDLAIFSRSIYPIESWTPLDDFERVINHFIFTKIQHYRNYYFYDGEKYESFCTAILTLC